MEPTTPITQLLLAWSDGDRAALDELTPLVYRELHRLARAYLNRGRMDTLQPTALINEAYLRLIGQAAAIQWENRAHFFGIARRLMASPRGCASPVAVRRSDAGTADPRRIARGAILTDRIEGTSAPSRARGDCPNNWLVSY